MTYQGVRYRYDMFYSTSVNSDKNESRASLPKERKLQIVADIDPFHDDITCGKTLGNQSQFKRGSTCALGLTKDLIDGDQPRAKLHLRKAKLNTFLNRF